MKQLLIIRKGLPTCVRMEVDIQFGEGLTLTFRVLGEQLKNARPETYGHRVHLTAHQCENVESIGDDIVRRVIHKLGTHFKE